METELNNVMENSLEAVELPMPVPNPLVQELNALRQEMKELRLFAERQQDSITSMIALSQQHTSIIEQQHALIQRLSTAGLATPPATTTF